MARTIRILRSVGIWLSGLVAAGAAGGAIGTAITYGYENQAEAGTVAGVFAFVCFRLWAGERRTPD